MKKPTPDTPAAIAFLKKWNPTGPWVLTAISLDKKSIPTRTFYPKDEEALTKWLEEYNGERNIYFQVNPPRRDLSKKSDKEDIKSLDWLHIDLDPRAGEDIDAERDRVLALLENPPTGIPSPTCIIFSGGGYQAFWKLEEPLPVDGDVEKGDQAARYSQQLSILFGGDHTHNIDRIMRLPGTVNLPDARKLKKGRTPMLAKLVEFHEDRVYPISMFIPAPEVQMSGGSGGSFATGSTVTVSGNIEFLDSIHDLDKYNVSDRVKVMIVQGRVPDEGPKAKDDSRSAWLFDCVCQLVRHEVPDDVIFSVIMDPGHGIAASVLEFGANAGKYAIKQIEAAKEWTINPFLRDLNAKHAVIGNMGGKCRVIEEVMDYALGRTRLTRQSFEDFRNRYMNQKVQIASDPEKGPVFMTLGKWWLIQSTRRQFETIVFAPNKDVQHAYNLWKGFAVTARPGKCELFLTHIKNNICQGNELYYSYLLGWMARAVQHPDSPGQTAIVLRGRMGTGKSFFVKAFGNLFGRHFLQVSDPKHLVGSFNAHLRDCVVLFGDEAFYAGDKKHESILKTLVTEETIIIEGKGVDAEAAPNYTHIILASNSQWVVPAGGDERRYFVLDVGNDQMQNSGYFKSIAEELDNGGREALLHYLMTYDLSEYDVRAVPKTSALHEQKLLSLAPDEEWWYGKLMDGRLLTEDSGWDAEVQKNRLLDDYIEYMKRIGIQRRSTSTALGKFLSRMCPGAFPRSYQKVVDVIIPTEGGWSRKESRRVYFYDFPTLAECRRQWDESFGAAGDWPAEQEALPLNNSVDLEPEPF